MMNRRWSCLVLSCFVFSLFIMGTTKKELHKRLCRCEQKLKKKYDRTQAIGICVKSVLHKRGYTHRGFTCKKKNKKLILARRKTKKKKRNRQIN